MNARTTCRIVLTTCLVGALACMVDRAAAQTAGRQPALATADLLVDLARDHGLNCRGKQTAADVLHVKTLLRAALRLDPRQTQACAWLYELALYGNQPGEAADVLRRLVQADPGNTAAFSSWLDVGAPDAQTVEQRRKWLSGLLNQQQPPENLALIYTRLARSAFQQADDQLARTHLDEAKRLWPECPDAVMLELELLRPDMPAARRLKVVLRALRANPVQVELAWQAGLLLDEIGFSNEALTFYEHAKSVHTAAGSGEPLASDKLLQLSQNALARRERAAALEYARQAASAERGTFEARFHLCWTLSKKPSQEEYDQVLDWLAKEFALIQEPDEFPVETVAQAAWFYCVIDEQPQRALMLAEDAAERAPGDRFATRVLGWAQALNGQTDEAGQTLEPLAKADPYAACRLARLLRDAGDPDAPARLLRELAYLPPAGRARELLDELGVPAAESQPAERFPEIVDLLSRFDRAVLEFHREPTRFLAADVAIDNLSPAPGEPWWLTFSLTNRADFPITLGPDWMFNPVFLLSLKLEGDRRREYPGLLTVALDRARVILPGQTLSVRRTIDVGPLRKISRQTPQHLQSVAISSILDPQRMSNEWQPSPTGLSLKPVSLVRLPANTDPEAWHVRFGTLKGDSPRARFQVLEVMAELLGEAQRAAAKPLAYKPQPIPDQRIKQALRTALESDSWETRLRTLDALQVAGLDRALVDAAQQCLDHPHWAVRMMAVRLLARQGKAFAETAGRIAAEDEDELVRDMARSYLKRWSVAEPGPATQPDAP